MFYNPVAAPSNLISGLTTHCQYCGTTLCEGCRVKYDNPYNFRSFTAEEAKWHSNILKKRSVPVMKLYDLTNENDKCSPVR